MITDTATTEESASDATRRAIELSLDPRGFPAEPPGIVTHENPVAAPEEMDYIPWGTPAKKLMAAGYGDDEEDNDEYSLLAWLRRCLVWILGVGR